LGNLPEVCLYDAYRHFRRHPDALELRRRDQMVLDSFVGEQRMAMLERNGSGGKQQHNYDLTWRAEPVGCSKAGCDVSYTFLYMDAEIRFDGTENVIDKMRREAENAVSGQHPSHFTQTCKWDGSEWAEVDSETARRSL
jgi:hypothetical protein